MKFEQTSGTPARVQVLYERAIADFPISSDLWLDYTRYLDKTLKVFLPLLFLIFIKVISAVPDFNCIFSFWFPLFPPFPGW